MNTTSLERDNSRPSVLELSKRKSSAEMAVAPIELAEVVEIEHDRGQVPGRPPALEPGDGEVQGGVEMPPVVEAGEPIVDGERRFVRDDALNTRPADLRPTSSGTDPRA